METINVSETLCSAATGAVLVLAGMYCGICLSICISMYRARRMKTVLQFLNNIAYVYICSRQEEIQREQERLRQEQEAQEQSFREAEQENTETEAKKIKVLFNGIWVSQEQFGFLLQSPAITLRGKELCNYLAMLAEHNALFSEYRTANNDKQSGKAESSRSEQSTQTESTSSHRNVHTKNAASEPNAYYRIFGLTPETLNEVNLKNAYRDLVKKYHPDTNHQPDAAEKFRKVKKVYAYLQDELRRKECGQHYAC